jgi:hypothetical protein
MLILYSTNTFLAFSIAERYYAQKHYFWCTPHFDARAASALAVSLPPTASPAEIYEGLFQEVSRGDLHSGRVAQNRSGILAGATMHKDRGEISAEHFDEIVEIVRAAQIQDFRPLLYVAPFDRLKDNLKRVPISARAHPLSAEYVAENVHRRKFDVIELPRSGR